MENNRQIVLSCLPDNDLYQALLEAGEEVSRYTSFMEAVSKASEENVLMILADSYPNPSLVLDEDALSMIGKKGLRTYLEYPLGFPGIGFNGPLKAGCERPVVSSDFFSPKMARLSILTAHDCWFMKTEVEDPHLVLARVAGYDKAVYGLPSQVYPILFNYSDSIIIATTKLSQFKTGRYSPSGSWRILWERILEWLVGKRIEINWSPTVKVAYAMIENPPRDVETITFKNAVHWFRNHTLFRLERNLGVMEGYQSEIDHHGNQLPRPILRSDCIAEASMVFALDWNISGNVESKFIAERLLDYVWSFQELNPESPSYGLVDWENRLPVFYGDDNARVILSTLTARRLLENCKWDEALIRCLLANFRTTGPLGFRRNRIDLPDLLKNNWRHYYETEVISYSPHYQAYLWACFLWAYSLTGYREFLKRTENAIRMTMAAYPRWRWTNGIMQEISRMLLPIAFTIRVGGDSECRFWASNMVSELIREQQKCGGIREKVGIPYLGQYPPSKSNDAYGVTEAPLIQENGDPACDLLYTVNFALIGLHEIVAVTGNQEARDAEDRLAEFLCRIQLRSDKHPYLNGCWMRGFDYEKWEYWGSSSDVGWGPWSIESGWTNSWITTTFGLRILDETLFSRWATREFGERFYRALSEMIPDQ